MQCVILEFFLDAPMSSLAGVDIIIGSLAFLDPISDLSRQKLHMLVWMRDIKIFIDAPLNFPALVEFVNINFKLLRLIHHTLGIKPGGQIEVWDYSTSSVSATLDTLLRW